MARKELNVFGASFIDLLAGALGAVLILYIIVPKLTISAEEYQKQQELTKQITQMGYSLESLSGLIPEDQLQKLRKQVKQLKQAKAQSDRQFEKIRNELEECKSEMAKIIADYRPYKQWMDSCGFAPGDPCPGKPGADVDVGFRFKDKNVVFLIDVSGSMQEQDKIGQVKAGIKMLLNTMSSDYNVDIVSYTTDANNRLLNIISPFWGDLKEVNRGSREQAYLRLNGLTPKGWTPTGSALKYVLDHYPSLSDIVLLTDGSPTPEDMGIEEILEMVRRRNTGTIRINTIGVGEYFTRNPNDQTVLFLQNLARQNDGFFIGF